MPTLISMTGEVCVVSFHPWSLLLILVDGIGEKVATEGKKQGQLNITHKHFKALSESIKANEQAWLSNSGFYVDATQARSLWTLLQVVLAPQYRDEIVQVMEGYQEVDPGMTFEELEDSCKRVCVFLEAQEPFRIG